MKRVLSVLNMGVPSGMQKFAGMRRFIAERGAWEIIPVRTRHDFRPELLEQAVARGIDGVFYSMEESEEGIALLSRMTIPTVVVDSPRDELAARKKNIAFFVTDNEGIAVRAADTFLAQGVFRSYACAVNDVESWWAKMRAAAFVKHLKQHGITEAHIVPGDATDSEIAEIFRALPKPCAIFAANDDRALEVLHICRQAGLAVPSQAAILGADNDESICCNTSPPLASIEIDFEQAGFDAAAVLDRMMDGETMDEPLMGKFGARRVVMRESMMKESPAGKLVQKALAFINHHAVEGIGVADVVRHLGVSRSLADRYFRQLQNTSINEAIVGRQLAELKERLVSSDAPIDTIVADCGFASPSHPKVLFKRRFGLSMREWRKSQTVR